MSEKITGRFLAAVNNVQSNALLKLPIKAKKEGKDCRGIVFDHTHLPVIQESPEFPRLVNVGDMRHTATFIIQDSNSFQLKGWDYNLNEWKIAATLLY